MGYARKGQSSHIATSSQRWARRIWGLRRLLNKERTRTEARGGGKRSAGAEKESKALQGAQKDIKKAKAECW